MAEYCFNVQEVTIKGQLYYQTRTIECLHVYARKDDQSCLKRKKEGKK